MVDQSLLRSLPLFASLEAATLEKLARQSTEQRLEAGEVLYLAGTETSALNVVVSGRVRVVRAHRGRQVLVHEEGPGGALGEVPLFAGGPYPATAIASEPTHCLQISLDAIRTAVHTEPDLAFVFLRRLALRLRGVVGQLDRFAVQSIETRLAELLLTRQAVAGQDRPFLLGKTQTMVAEELGTVREVLVRALKRFRELGLVEAKGRGYYTVEDAARLHEMAKPE